MASFDIIDAVGNGYSRVWAERRYLLKLAAVPVFLKFIALASIFAWNLHEHQLRLTFAMLPSYFAEGWMLAHMARLIFLDNRWPFQPSGDIRKDEPLLMERARGIMAGTIVYVIIQMALSGLFFGVQNLDLSSLDPERVDVKIAALLALPVLIWSFRYMWLNIPLAINYDLREFLRELGGFMISFCMMATWMVCFIPVLLIMSTGTFPVIFNEEGSFSMPMQIMGYMVQAALEALAVLLGTAAMCYGLRDMLERNRQ